MIIRTFAGTGQFASSGDGGPATEAAVGGPADVVVDTAGNTYIAEQWNHRIRKVDPSGIISTVVGTGARGFGGDGGPAVEATLSGPNGLALDASDNLYIADEFNGRVRMVDGAGIITTVAGDGESDIWLEDSELGDGGPATDAPIGNPVGVDVDSAGNLYIISSLTRVRKVDTSGTITTIAGTGNLIFERTGDGGPAIEADLWWPQDVAAGPGGNVFIAEAGDGNPNTGRVRMVDTAGTISSVAGGGTPHNGVGDGVPATEAAIQGAWGLTFDDANNLYIADEGRIRKVAPSGIITTVAGDGFRGFFGDDGPPTEAGFQAVGVAVDGTLGLLIADVSNARVRQVIRVPDLLSVTLSDSPSPVNSDQQLTYTAEVTNNGTGPATGAVVTYQLPPATEAGFVSASPSQGSCSHTGTTVTCALGELAAGATATADVAVAPTTAGTFIDAKSAVTANEDDPFLPNNTDTTKTAVGGPGCGQVITRSTRLSGNIGPCWSTGLIVGADNITVNLGGYRVYGFPRSLRVRNDATPRDPDGNTAGIALPNRQRAKVLNGTVSDFDAGILLNRGRSNTITNMTVRDNLGPDRMFVFPALLGDGIVLFNSAANLIANNVLSDNGFYDGIGVHGEDADDNVIRNNTVNGTVASAEAGVLSGDGIIVNATGVGAPVVDESRVITGTRLEGNVVRRNGRSGITSLDNIGAIIKGNTIEHNFLHGIGLELGFLSTTWRKPANVLIESNQVHANGRSGILLYSGVVTNRIIENNAADNALTSRPWYRDADLNDRNPQCDNNVWEGNVWGSGGFNPECTTAGGSGADAPTTANADEPAAANAQRSSGPGQGSDRAPQRGDPSSPRPVDPSSTPR